MIKRKISQAILKLKNKYPVISITGPRQSGKTTLAKKLFKNYQYYNLESLDQLSAAKDDPRGFLQIGSKKRLIIDEVQKYPDLLYDKPDSSIMLIRDNSSKSKTLLAYLWLNIA